MPKVLRVRNLRFFFYANEHDPPHVHVTIGKTRTFPHAKIMLETLEVTAVCGFSKADMTKILEIVEMFQEPLLEAWEVFFGEEE